MERTNEQNLDLLADLIEPAAEILADQDIRKAVNDGSRIKAVQIAIRNHKRAVIEMLARYDGEDPETYKVGVLTLPVRLVQILNRPEVAELFTPHGQKTESASSGSAMENTRAEGR